MTFYLLDLVMIGNERATTPTRHINT